MKVTLSIRQVDDVVEVSFVNGSKGPVVVVTLPQYLRIEMTNPAGQFVTGTPSGAAIPGRDDYVKIAAGESHTIRLPLGPTSIGSTSFEAIVPKAKVRIRYQASPIMPNLDSSQKKIFVAGPLNAEPTELS